MADKAKIQQSGKAKWTVMVYMAGVEFQENISKSI